jgi:hypothetical protein
VPLRHGGFGEPEACKLLAGVEAKPRSGAAGTTGTHDTRRAGQSRAPKVAREVGEHQAMGEIATSRAPAGAHGESVNVDDPIRWFSLVPRFTTG